MAKRQIFIFGNEHPMERKYFLDWYRPRIHIEGNFEADNSVVIAHVETTDDGKHQILCVVALNNWTPATCEGHIASDGTARWATRDFIYTVYQFAFEHGNRARMNFHVNVNNTPAVKMHEKLGHKREALLADAYGEGQDAYLYGLTKKQWKEGRFAKPSAKEKTDGNV